MPGTGAAASYGDLLVTSLVVLAAVCVGAFVVVRFLGRFLATGRARGAHLLEVVARVPLEPRRSLYVVEVAGKTLLVGTSEMGLSVLSELDAGEVRARVVDRPSFGELVRQAWSRRAGLARDAGRAGASGAASAGASGGAGATGGAGASASSNATGAAGNAAGASGAASNAAGTGAGGGGTDDAAGAATRGPRRDARRPDSEGA